MGKVVKRKLYPRLLSDGTENPENPEVIARQRRLGRKAERERIKERHLLAASISSDKTIALNIERDVLAARISSAVADAIEVIGWRETIVILNRTTVDVKGYRQDQRAAGALNSLTGHELRSFVAARLRSSGKPVR